MTKPLSPEEKAANLAARRAREAAEKAAAPEPEAEPAQDPVTDVAPADQEEAADVAPDPAAPDESVPPEIRDYLADEPTEADDEEGPSPEDIEPTGADAKASVPDPGVVENPLDNYIVLEGPASFGPIMVGGKLVRAKKGEPLLVEDPAEQLTILRQYSRLFRAAKPSDFKKTARKGGPLTVADIPEGGIKQQK